MSLLYGYLDTIPQVQAVFDIVAKFGFDLPGILNALRQLFGLPPTASTYNRAKRMVYTYQKAAFKAAVDKKDDVS